MTWTSPRTWGVGEVVSATNLNANVRDNFLDMNGTSSAWSSWTPVTTGATFTVTSARYKQWGKTIICRLTLTIATTGTGTISFKGPQSMLSGSYCAGTFTLVQGGTTTTGGVVFGDNFDKFVLYANTATNSTGSLAGGVNYTEAVGDVISANFIYEAA